MVQKVLIIDDSKTIHAVVKSKLSDEPIEFDWNLGVPPKKRGVPAGTKVSALDPVVVMATTLLLPRWCLSRCA